LLQEFICHGKKQYLGTDNTFRAFGTEEQKYLQFWSECKTSGIGMLFIFTFLWLPHASLK